MKKFFAMVMIISLCIPVSYASIHLKKSQPIMIDVTLNQSIDNANTSASKNNISLTQEDGWIAINGSQSVSTITNPNQLPQPPVSNQSLALVKILQADKKHVTLQFLILNQESAHYFVTQPQLIINYDEKSEIHIQDKHNKIELAVIANKTNRDIV